MPSRKMRTAIYFFYGLDVEIRPKSGVPHHPPELFIHLGGAIGTLLCYYLEHCTAKQDLSIPKEGTASFTKYQ